MRRRAPRDSRTRSFQDAVTRLSLHSLRRAPGAEDAGAAAGAAAGAETEMGTPTARPRTFSHRAREATRRATGRLRDIVPAGMWWYFEQTSMLGIFFRRAATTDGADHEDSPTSVIPWTASTRAGRRWGGTGCVTGGRTTTLSGLRARVAATRRRMASSSFRPWVDGEPE